MFQRIIQATGRYILTLLIACLGFTVTGFSQTPIFIETFGNTAVGGCDQNAAATTYIGPNGQWTVTLLGINDSAANKWYISATEPGLPFGSCATQGCHVNPVYTDRTLHIGNVPNSPNALTICPTGDCGALYDAGGSQTAVQTNARVESPGFSMAGNKQHLLVFNYLEFADDNIMADYATVEFFDGFTWVPSINTPPRTNIPCGTSSYRWGNASIILPVLPASVTNARIGFTWVNDNGGVGTSPSFAVDSIVILQMDTPVATITASDTDICVNDCIDFTADSVGPVASYNWVFTGAATPTSSLRNPVGICYPNPGTYTVSMIVNTPSGGDTAYMSIVVNPCSRPTADFLVSDSDFCERSCVNFVEMSTNGATQWLWSFPGGVPATSNSPSPPQVCYQTPGFYDVTLIVYNLYGSDTMTKTNFLHVDTCPVPVADFASGVTQFCPQHCVQFTDLSQHGPILGYDWYFPGGTPDTSSSSSPTICYDHDGQYDVQLIVTNQYGSDTVYKYSEVSVSYLPNAFISPDTSMRFGGSYQMLAGGGLTYQWSPSAGLDNDTVADPIATPKKTTTYTVQITDAQGCTAIRQVTITILQEDNIFVPNSFSPDGNGANDKLYVRGNNLYGVRLTVFDRWGEKVFETTNQNIGWDGTYNGEELGPGVFTYVVTVNYTDKESVTQSGTVTLIR